MLLEIVIFISLPAGYLFQETILESNQCKTLRNEFTTSNNLFLECVMKNNENATFCLTCANQYWDTLSAYNEFLNHTSCRSRFFENNQLNLVEMLLTSTKHVWDVGFCAGNFVLAI